MKNFNYKELSLMKRLLIPMSFVTTIQTFVIVFAILFSIDLIHKETIKTNMEMSTQNAMNMVQSKITTWNNVLNDSGEFLSKANNLEEKNTLVESELSNILNTLEGAESAFLAFSDENVFIVGDKYDFVSENYKEVFESQKANLFFNRLKDGVITIIVPITANTSKKACIGANIRVDILNEFLKTVKINESGYFNLVNSDGIVIASGREELTGLKDNNFDRLFKNNNKLTSINEDKKNMYAKLISLDDEAFSGMKVIGKTLVKEADKEIEGINILYILLGVVISTTFFIFTYIPLKYLIVKPCSSLIGEIDASKNEIKAASVKTSKVSVNLEEASENQKKDTDHIAINIQKTLKTINKTANGVKETVKKTEEANEKSNEGDKQIQNMVYNISEIKQSSDEISKIIKIIDDIAFQTNLLALNAAVEAARAGELGQGFAVVAEEVRNLAQKSSEAASSTESVIKTNLEASERGVEVANEVAEKFIDIKGAIEKVEEISNETSNVTEDQLREIEQINASINEVSITVEQIANMAKQEAKAGARLEEESMVLDDAVSELQSIIFGKELRIQVKN